MKILAWLLGAVVALFALAAIAFFLFFDANDFREDISKAVEKSTGRELVIEGDVSIQFFPWLAVEVGRSSLGNAPGFGDEPFASFERAQMSVRLLPLIFQQEVTVGGIKVDSLLLNLQQNRNGVSNWADLAASEPDAESADTSPGDAAVEVAGIEFVDATINYVDARSDSRYALSSANLKVGPISGDRQDMFVDGFLLDGGLDGVAAMPTRLRIETRGIGVQTVDEVVTLQPVEMMLLGMDLEARVEPFSYAGEIEPVAAIEIDAFSPRSLMTLFDTEPPETADPSALTRVIIDATAKVTSKAVELGDVTMMLDDTTFKGTLSVPRSSNGAYRFDLDADRIDLNRYMEPVAEAAEGAGDGGEAVPVEIPADLIRPLNARGSLSVATAQLGNMEFTDVELGLNTANGRMRIHPVSAGLFGGKYDGDVRIDVTGSTPAVAVDEKIEAVNLADLAKAMFEQDNITGTISGAFTLAGRGADMAAIQRSLSGNMAMQLSDGTYEGTDIWYELRRARALLKGEEAPQPELPARTRFSSLTATGVVRDGVMRNDDLFAELPFMQLKGSGDVDLAAATVDYDLTARVLERPESLAGVTDEELDDFTEAVIPLKITGPLASPSVKPDVERLLRKRVEDEIKDRLFDKLLGGGKEEVPAEEETGEEPAAEGEPVEEPEEPDIEEELKDKLKDLFGK